MSKRIYLSHLLEAKASMDKGLALLKSGTDINNEDAMLCFKGYMAMQDVSAWLNTWIADQTQGIAVEVAEEVKA